MMNTFGTRLSRVLYYLLMALLGLVAVGLIAGTVVLLISLLAPELLPSAAGRAVESERPIDYQATAIRMLAALLLAGFVIVQLLALLRSAARGNPFVAANVGRLRTIAAVFGLLFLAKLILPVVLPASAVAALDLGAPDFDTGNLLMLLLTLVLAEVFREGARLRDDADMTV